MSISADDQALTPAAARRTFLAIAWVYSAFLVEKLATLVTTAVLTRYLAPDEFGLIASAMLAIGLLSTFRDLGVPESLIYFDDRPEETNSTSFWIVVALGAVLSAALFLAAPWIAHWMGGSQELVQLLRVMSPALLISSCAFTHTALIQKKLWFSRRALVDFLTATLKAALTIALVLSSWKVWAIAYGYVFSSAFRTLALWLAVPFRPRLSFSSARAREMLNYGKHILGEGLLSNVVLYVDQIVILSLFGSSTLAYYYIAARIPELIIYQIAIVLTTVMFPTIAAIKNDPPTVARFVVQATRILSYVIYPVSLGIAAAAVPLLETIFGPNWVTASPFLIILSLKGLFATALWLVGDGLKAIGRPDKLMQITLTEAICSIPLTLVLATTFDSPIAASIGVLVAMLIANVQRFIEAKRLLGIAPWKLIAASSTSAAAALIMAACVQAIEVAMAAHGSLTRLTVEVTAGIIVYCAAKWLLDSEQVKADIAFITSRKLKRNI